ncbi:DUF192 domain-containing protein [Candidatus Saccharibacteria bacterium]|nr:DUF192 domain-containing protein [Candidatus Saccharibacteria bacterium]
MKRNKSAYVLVIIGLLILTFTFATLFSSWFQKSTRIIIGDSVISAKVMRTDAERSKGLGGKTKLNDGEGALFVYKDDDMHGIWMKDMKINIDIIWLNKDKKVVHIVKNAAPESYPKSFKPSKPARYVLEVPAGYTTREKINVGTPANFIVNAF